MSQKPNTDLAKLSRWLDSKLSFDQLKMLAFYMDVDHENLPNTKRRFIQEFLLDLQRRNKLHLLESQVSRLVKITKSTRSPEPGFTTIGIIAITFISILALVIIVGLFTRNSFTNTNAPVEVVSDSFPPTATETNTLTPSPTATETSAPTSTLAATATNTRPLAAAPTTFITPTATPTNTFTPSPTATETSVPTNTPTATATQTQTPTPTILITPTTTVAIDRGSDFVYQQIAVINRIVPVYGGPSKENLVLRNINPGEVYPILTRVKGNAFFSIWIEEASQVGWVAAEDVYIDPQIDQEAVPLDPQYHGDKYGPTPTPGPIATLASIPTLPPDSMTRVPSSSPQCTISFNIDLTSLGGDFSVNWSNVPAIAMYLKLEAVSTNPGHNLKRPLIEPNIIDKAQIDKGKFDFPRDRFDERNYDVGDEFLVTLTALGQNQSPIGCSTAKTFTWNGEGR